MSKFRTKPVVIEAYQNTGDSFVIKTFDGDMIVNTGDWLTIGIKGGRYPYKPNIFEATYEPVEEKEKCPDCKGRGEIWSFTDDKGNPFYSICPTCKDGE